MLVEEGRKRENVFNVMQGIMAVAGGETHQDVRLDLEEQPQDAVRSVGLILGGPKKPYAASLALRISAFADHIKRVPARSALPGAGWLPVWRRTGQHAVPRRI